MTTYTGIQIDVRLKANTPEEVIKWLSMHTLGEGNLPPVNALFTGTNILFRNWRGATIRYNDGDHPYWRLKVNSVVAELSTETLAFLLHELQPHLDMQPDEVLARTVDNVLNTDAEIYWLDPVDTLVQRRRSDTYTVERAASHPMGWSKEALELPLGAEEFHPKNTFSNYRKFHFKVNPKVGVKAEKKRILARQHNERYTQNMEAVEAAELAAMEKGA